MGETYSGSGSTTQQGDTEPKLSNASVSEIRKHKANRVREIEADIKRYQEYIAAAEDELKEWESV